MASVEEFTSGYDKPFSINITWVNNRFDPDQRYIFPCRDEEELKGQYLDCVVTWAQKNPGPNCSVNIWYDGALLNTRAVDNTKVFLAAHYETAPLTQISYRNFRDIPLVSENAHAFEETVPVYFRADLLRVVAALHDLKTEQTSCFIFANCNFPPLGTEALFDRETCELLSCFGHLFSNKGLAGYENCFIMMTRDCPEMVLALERGVVQYSIERARDLVTHPETKRVLFNHDRGSDVAQHVFSSYPKAFLYCYAMLAKEEIKPYLPDHYDVYDWDKHGTRLFYPSSGSIWQLGQFLAPRVSKPPKSLVTFMENIEFHKSLSNVYV
ncbi:MAG: hypothetical protein LCH26_05300, partial [Proteobacteria bacterium]|nr:hypothetical protein [Pseudomonadota bacterium]